MQRHGLDKGYATGMHKQSPAKVIRFNYLVTNTLKYNKLLIIFYILRKFFKHLNTYIIKPHTCAVLQKFGVRMRIHFIFVTGSGWILAAVKH